MLRFGKELDKSVAVVQSRCDARMNLMYIEKRLVILSWVNAY